MAEIFSLKSHPEAQQIDGLIKEAGVQTIFSQPPHLVEGSVIYPAQEDWQIAQVKALTECQVIASLSEWQNALTTRGENVVLLVLPDAQLDLATLEQGLARAPYCQIVVWCGV